MYSKKPIPKYKIGDVIVTARCAVPDNVGQHGYIKEVTRYPDGCGYCNYVVKFFGHDTPRGFVEDCLELVT